VFLHCQQSGLTGSAAHGKSCVGKTFGNDQAVPIIIDEYLVESFDN